MDPEPSSDNVATQFAGVPLDTRVFRDILERLHTLVDYTSVAISLIDGEDVVIADYVGPGATRDFHGERTPLNIFPGHVSALAAGSVTVIDDIRHHPSRESFHHAAKLLGIDDSWERARLTVPLRAEGRVIGFLTLVHERPGFYSERDGEVALAFAAQAALTIENMRLLDDVRRRTRELTALLEVSRIVASTLELRPVVSSIIDQLRTVIAYDAAGLILLEDGEAVLQQLHVPQGATPPQPFRIPLENLRTTSEIVRTRRPLLIEDAQAGDHWATVLRADLAGVGAVPGPVRSYLAVPLLVRDRAIGQLSLGKQEPCYFTDADVELVFAFASQVAVAIENAQLYEQSRQLAVVEERQRIARELHDSVSQALYGILLSASAVRNMLDTDPKEAIEPVDSVVSLASAGLAEMRALLFELRPESLETEGLVAAIEKRAIAVRARYGLAVHLSLCSEPNVPLRVKETFARVQQEAVHNVIKHAGARTVDVTLDFQDGALRLTVRDDGSGFDAEAGYPGHLGLASMRERLALLAGELRIESLLGVGTTVTAAVQVP
jgi:signal transduction histidine kinase